MSLHFDSSVTVSYAEFPVLDRIPLDEMTIILWARPTETAHDLIPRLVTTGAGDLRTHWGSIWATDGLGFRVNRATTTAWARSSESMTIGTWYYIAATYSEADGPRIFKAEKTGVLDEDSYQSRQVGAGATDFTDDPLMYGNRTGAGNQNDGNGFRGDIARVALFNKRLHVGEIKALRSSTRWADHPRIICVHDLGDRGGAGSIPDLSPGGLGGINRNGSLVAGPGVGSQVAWEPRSRTYARHIRKRITKYLGRR